MAEALPRVTAAMSPAVRGAATELAHWGYGALGGAAFALLPESLRSRRAAGPLFGLAIWVGFERVIAPLLGLRREGRRVRAALAADHVLYGVLVAEARRPRS